MRTRTRGDAGFVASDRQTTHATRKSLYCLIIVISGVGDVKRKSSGSGCGRGERGRWGVRAA
jgi:hypothetical protein